MLEITLIVYRDEPFKRGLRGWESEKDEEGLRRSQIRFNPANENFAGWRFGAYSILLCNMYVYYMILYVSWYVT